MLNPIDVNSCDYASHEANIAYIVAAIRAGEGDHEVDLENGGSRKTSLLPLSYFCNYIKNGQYPHPTVLAYFADVFAAILDGEDAKRALALVRPSAGRRPVANDAKLRNTQSKIGSAIYFRVHRASPNQMTLAAAVKEVGEKFAAQGEAYSPENLTRFYYQYKADYDAGRDAALRLRG
jgi:hypothetical protein